MIYQLARSVCRIIHRSEPYVGGGPEWARTKLAILSNVALTGKFVFADENMSPESIPVKYSCVTMNVCRAPSFAFIMTSFAG